MNGGRKKNRILEKERIIFKSPAFKKVSRNEIQRPAKRDHRFF